MSIGLRRNLLNRLPESGWYDVLPILFGLLVPFSTLAALTGGVSAPPWWFWLIIIPSMAISLLLFRVGSWLLSRMGRSGAGRSGACGGNGRAGAGAAGHRRLSSFPVWLRPLVRLNRYACRAGSNGLVGCMCGMLACWLPYILLCAPGIWYQDTVHQARSFLIRHVEELPAGWVYDHHPFLTTWAYGWPMRMSYAMTGNLLMGIYIVYAAHLMLTALGFSVLLTSLHAAGIGGRQTRFASWCFCLFPLFPIIAVSIAKDTMHAWLLAAFAGMLVLLVRNGFEQLRRPGFVSFLVLVCIGVALSRKTGAYMALLALTPAAMMAPRVKARRRITAISIGVAVPLFALGLLPLAYPLLHVYPGDVQSAVSPLVNQVALAERRGTRITAEERAAIESFLSPITLEEMGENYRAYITDPAMPQGAPASRDDDRQIGRFIKAWAAIGLRNPAAYADAYATLESGWSSLASVGDVYSNPGTDSGEPEPGGVPQINGLWSESKQPLLGHNGGDLQRDPPSDPLKTAYAAIRNTPVINIPTWAGWYATYLPMLVLYETIRRYAMKKRGETTGNAEAEDVHPGMKHVPDDEKRARSVTATRERLACLMPLIISVLLLYVTPVSISTTGDHGENATRYLMSLLPLLPAALAIAASAWDSGTANDRHDAEMVGAPTDARTPITGAVPAGAIGRLRFGWLLGRRDIRMGAPDGYRPGTTDAAKGMPVTRATASEYGGEVSGAADTAQLAAVTNDPHVPGGARGATDSQAADGTDGEGTEERGAGGLE